MSFVKRKKVFVASSSVRVYEDKNLPNLLQSALIDSRFRGISVSDAMLENVLNSNALKFEQAYKYGASGDYYYGLPDTTLLTAASVNPATRESIKTKIETETSRTITFDYIQVGALNATHAAWQYLQDSMGYDTDTNRIGSLEDTETPVVYLKHIQPHYFHTVNEVLEESSIAQWGVSSLAGQTHIRAKGAFNIYPNILVTTEAEGINSPDAFVITSVTAAGVEATLSQSIDALPYYAANALYFHVCYTYDDAGTVRRGYWTYRAESGIYPDLDVLYTTPYTGSGTYFPFVVFRRNDMNMTDPALAETDEYKSSKKMARLYNMNYADVGASIHENPDIEEVDQAVLMMGVPLDSEDPLELRYLYDFFTRLADEVSYSLGTDLQYDEFYNRERISNVWEETFATKHILAPPNLLTFQDADFEMVFQFGGVIKRIKAGSIGEKGTITRSITDVEYATSNYDVTGGAVVNPGQQRKATTKNLVISKQISDALYEELIVISPTLRYQITEVNHAYAELDDPENVIIIPLDRSITTTYQLREKDLLYHRALRFVFNARVVQKLAWYETTLFRAILEYISVVLTVLSFGTTSFLIALVRAILVYAAAKFVFKVVADKFGHKVSTAIVVALVVIALLLGNGNGAREGSAYFADSLLLAANGLMQGINIDLEEKFSEIIEEQKAFQTYADAKMSELEQAQAELENSNMLLDPLLLMSRTVPFTVHGESPESFYNRTVNSGNVGVFGIKYIETYVQDSLTLPTIEQTLGAYI